MGMIDYDIPQEEVITAFTGLTDTPAVLTPDKFLQVNPAGDAIIEVDAPAGGAATFIALTDTPASLTPDKFLQVNPAGDAIIEVDAPSGGDPYVFGEFATKSILLGTFPVGLTGTNNTIVGIGNATGLSNGTDNVAIGADTGPHGYCRYNVLIGNDSGLQLTTGGDSNTFIGDQAGRFITTGDGNVAIGRGADFSGFATASNQIVIGWSAVSKGANTVVLGNDSVTETYLKGALVLEAMTAGEVLTVDADGETIISAPASGGGDTTKYDDNTIVAGTAHSFTSADAGNIIDCQNAADTTLTMLDEGTTPMAINTRIDVIQTGAGQVSIIPVNAGVIIYGNNKTAGVYQAVSLWKKAANTWVVIGGVT